MRCVDAHMSLGKDELQQFRGEVTLFLQAGEEISSGRITRTVITS